MANDVSDLDVKWLRSRAVLAYVAGNLSALSLYYLADALAHTRLYRSISDDYVLVFRERVFVLMAYNAISFALPAFVTSLIFINNPRVKRASLAFTIFASVVLLAAVPDSQTGGVRVSDALALWPVPTAIAIAVLRGRPRRVRSLTS